MASLLINGKIWGEKTPPSISQLGWSRKSLPTVIPFGLLNQISSYKNEFLPSNHEFFNDFLFFLELMYLLPKNKLKMSSMC
jgi:hypothetical protein